MEKTRQTCSYCLSALQGVSCPHCDRPHSSFDCTLCSLAITELQRKLRGLKR